MTKYVDETGVENVAVGIIKQAKKDFIKGAKQLYALFGKIPTEKENRELGGPEDQDIRMLYDSWRFVICDPYQLFGDEQSVINAWKAEAIEEHYRKLYLAGAEILYVKHAPKELYYIPDEEVIKLIEDAKVAADFISARNYIFSLPEGKKTLREWNVIAFSRAKHPVKRRGRKPIQDTDYSKNMSKQKKKNIKKAKEMYEDGISPREIAKELGVHLVTARMYLRS